MKKPPLVQGGLLAKKLLTGSSEKSPRDVGKTAIVHPIKKKALRRRQKIFTTNNHYEWSK
jgi:hypothetical protein